MNSLYKNCNLIYKITFLLIFIGWNSQISFAQQNSTLKTKINQVIENIDNAYVDTMNMESLVNKTIVTMLKELDPHSIYIDKKDVERVNQQLEGNFEGIGIEYNILDDTIYVITINPNGPSERAGLKPGDRIIKIADVPVASIKISTQDVRKKLMGSRGTQVKITVKRKGSKKLLDYMVIRDRIPIKSLDAAYLIDKSIAYIKLNRFSATTLQEYSEAITHLQNKGATELILDLRDNGGGYLSAATDLADEFLDGDKMIVYTEGSNNPKMEYKATSYGSFQSGKLVVLIDEGSASASEIVTGAVQDWDRGIVIGRRSFGKGLVQRPFNLADGSVMRLTIARYFTPSGRLIQKSYKNGTKDYNQEVNNRYTHGELANADSIKFPDSLKYYTLQSRRLVYGGGGIMPDYFVPIDTLNFPAFYQNWLQNGAVNDYILSYLDNNRKMLEKKYPDFQTYKKQFVIDENLFKQLEIYSEKANPKLPENTKKTNATITFDYGTSKENIRVQLKALLARDIWTLSEYYEIINEISPVYKKAIEVLEDNSLYEAKLNP